MAKQQQKQVPSVPNPNELYNSALDIDPKVKEEINKKGLVARWINATDFTKNHGFHRSGWAPFKSEAHKSNATSLLFGGDPEGYVRRGDLVLAVKTSEQSKRHKSLIDAKNARLKGINKSQADDLRKAAKSAGFDTEVSEGFGEDDGDEDKE